MSCRQKQLRKQCEEWLHSEEAVSLIKQQCKVIKKETDTTAKPVSKGGNNIEIQLLYIALYLKIFTYIQNYQINVCRRYRKSCSQYCV